jgi:hypothetical protein
MKILKTQIELPIKQTRKRSDRQAKNLINLQNRKELKKQLRRISLQNKFLAQNKKSFQKNSKRAFGELLYFVIDRIQEILLVSIVSFTLLVLMLP